MATFLDRFHWLLDPNFDQRTKIQLLQGWRLLADRPNCANCNNRMSLERRPTCNDGYRWRCHARVCRRTRGLRVGTVFEGIEFDLGKLTVILYFWTLQQTGATIIRQTGINKNVLSKLRARLRSVCTLDLAANQVQVQVQILFSIICSKRSLIYKLENNLQK